MTDFNSKEFGSLNSLFQVDYCCRCLNFTVGNLTSQRVDFLCRQVDVLVTQPATSADATIVYRTVLRGTFRRDLKVEHHQEGKTERPSSANHGCCVSFVFVCSWIFVIAAGVVFFK